MEYNQIKLNYLGKYKEKVEPIKNEKIPKDKFTHDFLKKGIMEKSVLMKESNKFDVDVKEYVKQNDIKSSINVIYLISQTEVNTQIQIINNNISNEKEISEICEIYFKGEKINFTFFYTFNETGKYELTFVFKDFLKNASKLFYKCKSIISLDLKNFKTDFIIDMSHMFRECSLIQTLNLSSFNTKEVKTMEGMFCGCSSLKNIDLSSFIDIEVINMK